MDIDGPKPEEQISQWPHVEAERNVDMIALVHEAIEQHPGATPDEIAKMLKQFQVSAIFAAEQMTLLAADGS
jgi:hypothetical protein